jgi:hypothetical protein
MIVNDLISAICGSISKDLMAFTEPQVSLLLNGNLLPTFKAADTANIKVVESLQTAMNLMEKFA